MAMTEKQEGPQQSGKNISKETKFEIMKLASHWPKQITWPIPNSKGGEVYSFHGSGRGRSKYF